MKYAVPLYPPTVVNAAGRALKDGKDHLSSGEHVLSVINNWRASHNHILMVFYVTLSSRSMNLSQMQDIGGCRAVMRSMSQVKEMLEIYKSRPVVHHLVGIKNYIDSPKADGYRGIHLIYKYVGTGPKNVYTGQRVEIQIRTQLQHIWATAVEAAGTFTKQALKSNQGRHEWLRFFACMSTYFALRESSTPTPSTPEDLNQLRQEVIELNSLLHVVPVLQSYTVTAKKTGEQRGKKYFLVHLDPHAQLVKYQGYRHDESEEANLAYTRLEAELANQPDVQVVLVSVDSIRALRRAYPNYFLDTSRFVREVELFMAGAGGSRLVPNAKINRPPPPMPPRPSRSASRKPGQK
jgi:hypothetical protein